MTKYKEQLQTLQDQITRKNKVTTMLKNLYGQRRSLEEEERVLAALRKDEQADVDRMKGHSLAAFFYEVIGKREEMLDKETREAYAAAVKHENAVQQLRAVEDGVSALEAELKTLEGCEVRYAEVLRRKAEALKSEDPVNGPEICRMEERMGYLESQRKEISEALSAGNAAMNQIQSIESELDSAEGWGTWDLFGGGLISGLAKHSHLDDAQVQIEELQMLLRRFHTELGDVDIHSDIQVQVEGFLRFADFFFDGLFADWAVLNHIHDSQEKMGQIRQQVQMVLDRLHVMDNTQKEELHKLREKLYELVAGA
ncbi:MAG: hypothetical protein LKK00_03455 [Intestinimonas sp.]|jgi:hypothetical protein|nr:hypothetical protein [Intestinimonas sp.]